ncbi:MAG TPA: ankyrin repeat domain-containing protein [Chlamydiales bacterium]|nr:ankyrin repeat domain-containing protein [Chlamydiales bacterium]
MRIENFYRSSQSIQSCAEQDSKGKTSVVARDVFASLPTMGIIDPLSVGLVAALVIGYFSWKGDNQEMNRQNIKSKKAMINHRSNDGNTALHFQVKLPSDGDSVRICKLLLENGADPNIPDNEGNTPLDTAKKKNDKELISLLKSYGARSKR